MRQRGSTVAYLIVGIVLFATLFGVMWWAKNYTVTTQPAAQTSANQDRKEPAKEETTASQNTSPTAPASPAPDSTTSSRETAPAATSQPNTTDVTTAAPTTPSPATPSSSAVAQTGPTETFAALISFGFVTYFGAAYLQSRKTL